MAGSNGSKTDPLALVSDTQTATPEQLAAQLANADEARSELADRVSDQDEDLATARAMRAGAEQDLRRVTRERDDLAPWRAQLLEVAQLAAKVQGLGVAMPTDADDVAEIVRAALAELAGVAQPVGCIWCGQEVSANRLDLGTAALVRAHMTDCKKNPTRGVERERDAWKSQVTDGQVAIDAHRKAQGKAKGHGSIARQVTEMLERIDDLEEQASRYEWHHQRLAEADERYRVLSLDRDRLANRVLDLEEREAGFADLVFKTWDLMGKLGAGFNEWRARAQLAEKQLAVARAQPATGEAAELLAIRGQLDAALLPSMADEKKLSTAERVDLLADRMRRAEMALAEREEAHDATIGKVWAALGIEPGASAVLPDCVAAMCRRAEAAPEPIQARAERCDDLAEGRACTCATTAPSAKPRFCEGADVTVDAKRSPNLAGISGRVTKVVGVGGNFTYGVRDSSGQEHVVPEEALTLDVPF